MIDRYFKAPLLWDYTIANLLFVLCIILKIKGVISLPKSDYAISIASDLSNVALTLAGFILTLLTVLITFKSGSKLTKKSNIDDEKIFDVFFITGLYFETVKHLKNCVKSLVIIAILGYSLKICLPEESRHYIFFYNVFGFIIIILTLVRSLLILTKIIHLQKEDE